MARDGRSSIWTARTAGLLGLALLAAGCARDAPALPSSSVEDAQSSEEAIANLPPRVKSLTCSEVDQKLRMLDERDAKLEAEIKSHRSDNQTAGYIAGVIFPPALLATESNEAEKTMLDENQKHRDELILAQRARRCSTTVN